MKFKLYLLLIPLLIACSEKKVYETDLSKYKLLKDEPLQEEIDKDFSIVENGFKIKAIKKYQISARVLGKEEYSFDKSSSVSPIDFALGWNKMSDLKLLKNENISISQFGRFYFWKYKTELKNITRQEIIEESANTHLIPANKKIKSYMLSTVKKDDIIYMEGYLVNVSDEKDKNATWNSSTTRTDSGDGACEIFYVTGIRHLEER